MEGCNWRTLGDVVARSDGPGSNSAIFEMTLPVSGFVIHQHAEIKQIQCSKVS